MLLLHHLMLLLLLLLLLLLKQKHGLIQQLNLRLLRRHMLLQMGRSLLALKLRLLRLLRWQLLRLQTPLLRNRHTVLQWCDELLLRGVASLRLKIIREGFLRPLPSLRLLALWSAAMLHDY